MKEHNKTPEKELNEKEIANLSDAEFKILMIRILRELIECGHKIKEEMKNRLSEIKKNIQGTNSKRKEASILINNWEQKEKINIQSEKK